MYFFKINLNLNQIETKDIRISDNKEHTCLKIGDKKIIVHPNELGFSITSFDLNDGMVLFYFKTIS